MSLDQTDPKQYQLQLDNKIAAFKQTMADAGLEIGSPTVYQSAPLGFRMRAEFRIWHEQEQVYYGMNRRGEKRPYIIEDFPIGAPLINQLMPPVLAALNASPVLSRKCFSAEFLTSTAGEALITLIYHRPLDAEWEAEARALQARLKVNLSLIHI